MGQDYSYSQPSSSEEYDIDITSLLQAEADIYADEAESSQNKADDGIPKTCYCGGQPVVATSYTSKDPGRRYFTCDNADDGDCHVWKWWDVAVMEEMSDFQRQLREVKDQRNECEQKLVKLEETVWELAKKKSGVRDGFPMVVCVMVSVFVLICMVVMFKRVEEKSATEHSPTMDSTPGFVNMLNSQ
ncbi:hypothetical protein F2Q68_00011307 [Brassica cretica]|uniref:GRF-type domain-containing protein n=1 Tax=Brassica cretica TaxID=69181 RepID=A0A8S9KUN4_BRACR|nr:hypothetical protein F2Q68_00011307 [Brassica cretica]